MKSLKQEFLDFFREGTKNSMNRLVTFIGAMCGVILILMAPIAMHFDQFDGYYVTLTLGLLGVAGATKVFGKKFETPESPIKETTEEDEVLR